MGKDPSEAVSPPNAETTKRLTEEIGGLRAAVDRLASAREGAVGTAVTDLAARVGQLTEDLEQLRPWVKAFTGSSFVLDSALKDLEDLGDLLALQSPGTHPPAAGVLAMLVPPATSAAEAVEKLARLLPDHLEVAKVRRRRGQSFLYRVRTLPPELRRRVWLRAILGSLMLLTSIVGVLLLLFPALARAVGLGHLLATYTASSIVVVAVVAFAGVRTVWASAWLAASARIASDYDDRLETRAMAGLERREQETLNPPRAP